MVNDISEYVNLGSLFDFTISLDGEIARACGGEKPNRVRCVPIEKVIYNSPATVVYFTDGGKSVVKCDGKDEYSKLTGLCMAVLKYYVGSKALREIIEYAYK